MVNLIPAFDFQRVMVAPWTEGFNGTIWIALMGVFVATACGLVGNYLILRRMALVGDAISLLFKRIARFIYGQFRLQTQSFRLGALLAGTPRNCVLTATTLALQHAAGFESWRGYCRLPCLSIDHRYVPI